MSASTRRAAPGKLWRRRPPRRATVTVLGLAAALSGCSGTTPAAAPLPPAPEPATAPAPTAAPAGDVLPLPAGSQPEGIAADPVTGEVVVALRKPDRLALVPATLDSVRTVDVTGAARHLGLAKPGGPVLVPGEDTDQLVQVALPEGNAVASTRVGRQPHNATYADGRIYVADEFSKDVDVLDAGTGRVVATLPGPVQPGGVAVTGGVVSAVDVRGARLYTWDQQTLRPLGSVAIGAGPTHEVEIGDGALLVADTRGNQLLVVDPRGRRVVHTMALAGTPYGLAADPQTGRAWVTLTATNEVVQVQVAGGDIRQVRRWPTVRQPNTVAYQPGDGCLFLTGTADAQLQRVCDLPGV